MNIYYYVHPRQTGKTTSLISEFLREPEQTLFVSLNQHIKNLTFNNVNVKNRYHNYEAAKNNFITSYDFIKKDSLRGRNFTKILIDEYDHMDDNHKKGIYEYVIENAFNLNEIIIRTTSKRLYSEKIYDLVRCAKVDGLSLKQTIYFIVSILDVYEKNIEEQIMLLYNSLITHPECQLIFFNPSNVKKYNKHITDVEKGILFYKQNY